MSHHFESGLFFGKEAWHGLGVTLPADSPARRSVSESIVASSLDWNADKEDLYAGGKLVTTHKAVVRSTDKSIIGIVGNRHETLQNRQMFDWFQPFLDSGDCVFETCGSLKGGAVIWVLAKLAGDNLKITADDEVAKYLLLSSTHDGSGATTIAFNPIRVICWNTLSAALRAAEAKSMLRIRHTTSQSKALIQVRETINLVEESFQATADQYRKLAACGINRAELRRYVKLVLELPEDDKAISTRQRNILDGIVKLAIEGVGNDGKTAWDAYNGVTQYATHTYGRNAENRLRSAWYGEGRKLIDRGLAVGLQLAS